MLLFRPCVLVAFRACTGMLTHSHHRPNQNGTSNKLYALSHTTGLTSCWEGLRGWWWWWFLAMPDARQCKMHDMQVIQAFASKIPMHVRACVCVYACLCVRARTCAISSMCATEYVYDFCDQACAYFNECILSALSHLRASLRAADL